MSDRWSSEKNSIVGNMPIGQVMGNGERVPLTGLLRFDPTDPIAITLVVRMVGDQMVEWTFARDLLAAGGHQPAGVGDVRIGPSQGDRKWALTISLTGPEGQAELELPSRRVGTFLRQTYAAVPAEMEASLIDWGSEFESLLGPQKPTRDGSPDR
ncbi:SsgA family sporulation/cell division regulator [Pseudofrankia asymbiotica]|uniref:Sporulation protein SsgA n=1 Tax=Pseudofrankia asymbiotica TaxID=1834516 RepID=A0A1V2I9V7_9ACTN|nr:SsgA family sporulation/cell division regulator [Pseudofrankia asymbiotica]ONH28854.1 hypothetical protein BL253_18655 [Pseudofrankia asymbiotica]